MTKASMHSGCLFVAIEGLDGVGKTSTAAYVSQELKKRDLCVIVRQYEKAYFRSAFRHARERKDPQLKYVLQAAALMLICEEIAKAPENAIFICDRYYFSARAYYLATHGQDLLRSMAQFLCNPDVPILLECSAMARRRRLLDRKAKLSRRKLDTTAEPFHAAMNDILVRSAAWYRINNEHLTLRETGDRVCEMIMGRYYEQK